MKSSRNFTFLYASFFLICILLFFGSANSQPILILPHDYATNASCETDFDWGSESYWDNYQLQVSRQTNFGSTVISTTTSHPYYTVEYNVLDPSTVYYWHVKAHNHNSGNWTGWSGYRQFTTGTRPSCYLSSPSNGAVNLTSPVYFSWTSANGAGHYHLFIADNPDFNGQMECLPGSATNYSWAVPLMNKTYYWKVRPDGTSMGTYTNVWSFSTFPIGIQNISISIPKEYKLYDNYPNPFNPVTYIKFDLPRAGFVALEIYDVLGRELAPLVSEELSAGTYRVDWDASAYASGIYFYIMKTGDRNFVKRMILIK